jgi:hypothetical protein
MTLDQWAELWFRHQVNRGQSPAMVLSELEAFRASMTMLDCQRPTLPRIVAMADRYIIVELALAERGSTTAIFCRRCYATSYNPNDVQQLYCGGCHQYHS